MKSAETQPILGLVSPKFRSKRYLWVLGGLALGGLAGVVLGVLVFWVYPAVQKSRSPLREVEYPPLVLHYLKDSPVAQEIATFKAKLRNDWLGVLEDLGLALKKCLPLFTFTSLPHLLRSDWESPRGWRKKKHLWLWLIFWLQDRCAGI
jgi:hypothetical protein